MRTRILVAQGDYAETVWAKRLGNDLYEIDNIPFGIYNLSLGDVVKGHATPNGSVAFDGVYDKRGARTVRISGAAEDWLEQRQLAFESYDSSFCVSLPAEAPLDDILIELETMGLEYVKLDPNPAYEIPIVPGSPAEKQYAARSEDAWTKLVAFVQVPLFHSDERHFRTTLDVHALTREAKANGFIVHTLDCARTRHKNEFMDETARALSFPDYFGKNWDAFAECLDDLAQDGRKHLVVFLHADELLKESPADLRILVDVLTQSPIKLLFQGAFDKMPLRDLE